MQKRFVKKQCSAPKYQKRYLKTIAGSRRALEKAGFTQEARFKEAIRINGVYDDEAAYTFWRP